MRLLWKPFLLIVLHALFAHVFGDIGVVFSPFVRDGDSSSTTKYTKDDVKVMLELIQEDGYNMVATYGIGSVPGHYERDESWKRSSSIKHTALAAAELNEKHNSRVLRVFQGLYVTPVDELSLKTEVEVGFEVVAKANDIYRNRKTVVGIVFPSIVSTFDLTDTKMTNFVKEIAARTRSHDMVYGARISDCENFENWIGTDKMRRLTEIMNFTICLMNPNDFSKGPERFASEVMGRINRIKQLLAPKVEVMLETGWPGRDQATETNTNEEDLMKFWRIMERHKQNMDIFMHEAFDNPWKGGFNSHYGRWKHTQTNDTSKNAYEIKKTSSNRRFQRQDGGPSTELIVGIIFGLVLFLALSVIIFLVYRRITHQIKKGNKLSDEEIRQFRDGAVVTNEVVDERSNEQWTRVPYNRDFELDKEKFTIDKDRLLGEGAFGSVYRGRITGIVGDVAFKMNRPDCPLSALRGLLSEIKILTYLGKHENVVSICGAYTAELTNGIVYLAIELCPNGSLEKFLRANKTLNGNDISHDRYVDSPSQVRLNPITEENLLKWSIEIASAMEYISSKNIIHADLACRNVLLSSNLTAKVTDFGLSRRLYEYTEYVKKQQEPLPWRWMAIESLRCLEFSTNSDAWSYAVTLWEIYSLGDIPYPGLTWNVNFVSELERGLRLQKPDLASSELYEIMTRCWDNNPHSRPSFKTIKEALQTIN